MLTLPSQITIRTPFAMRHFSFLIVTSLLIGTGCQSTDKAVLSQATSPDIQTVEAHQPPLKVDPALEYKAAQGDPVAQFQLGAQYLNGLTGDGQPHPQSDEKGFYLLKKGGA